MEGKNNTSWSICRCDRKPRKKLTAAHSSLWIYVDPQVRGFLTFTATLPRGATCSLDERLVAI